LPGGFEPKDVLAWFDLDGLSIKLACEELPIGLNRDGGHLLARCVSDDEYDARYGRVDMGNVPRALFANVDRTARRGAYEQLLSCVAKLVFPAQGNPRSGSPKAIYGRRIGG
jgi:hypothetical protein